MESIQLFIWLICTGFVWMFLLWMNIGAKIQVFILLLWGAISYYGYNRDETTFIKKVGYEYGGLQDRSLIKDEISLIDKLVWAYKYYTKKITGGKFVYFGWFTAGILGTFMAGRVQYWFSHQTSSWAGWFIAVCGGVFTLIIGMAFQIFHHLHDKAQRAGL
jgi:hypothetical protein